MDAAQPEELAERSLPVPRVTHPRGSALGPGLVARGGTGSLRQRAKAQVELLEEEMRWVKGWRALVVAFRALPCTPPDPSPGSPALALSEEELAGTGAPQAYLRGVRWLKGL